MRFSLVSLYYAALLCIFISRTASICRSCLTEYAAHNWTIQRISACQNRKVFDCKCETSNCNDVGDFKLLTLIVVYINSRNRNNSSSFQTVIAGIKLRNKASNSIENFDIVLVDFGTLAPKFVETLSKSSILKQLIKRFLSIFENAMNECFR